LIINKRFHNLDGLRFSVALIVVLTHVESIKNQYHLSSFYASDFFVFAGALAVNFFFVLSGFLIATMLMTEKKMQLQNNGNINIIRFYKNRIRRIWPLYYLLVLTVFIIFPLIPFLQYPDFDQAYLGHHLQALLLYLIFCPHLSDYIFGNTIYSGQFWSLGAEEFFYLFFPVGLYLLGFRHYLQYFIGILLLSVLATVYFKITGDVNFGFRKLFYNYLLSYKLYTFAFGAIAAYINFTCKDYFSPYENLLKRATMVLLILLCILMFSGQNTFHILQKNWLFALLFALLILFSTLSSVRIKALDNKAIRYLGKISFSIYMLHPLAVVIAIKLFYFDTGNVYCTAILFSLIAVVVTILLSVASYTCIEKPFLKKRFATTVIYKNDNQ
jgi:peptidoglycan/LPS O-acetylase OafA/YrhL